MKKLRIYVLLSAISFFGSKVWAQNDSIQLDAKEIAEEIPQDSIEVSKYPKAGKLFVGGDLFQPVLSAFTPRKGFQGVVSYRVYRKWNAVAEVGFEKNEFDKLDWKVNADGIYMRLGFNWFISQDYQNPPNGFYLGARFGYSLYNQEIKQYPIRLSSNQVDEFGSLPRASVNSYWAEIVGGARIQLWKKFYADVSVRPEFFIGGKKQNEIDPLVIPGFGKYSGSMNIGVFWGLTYEVF